MDGQEVGIRLPGEYLSFSMAEAVEKMVHEEGLEDKITIDSAAANCVGHGNPVHHGTPGSSARHFRKRACVTDVGCDGPGHEYSWNGCVEYCVIFTLCRWRIGCDGGSLLEVAGAPVCRSVVYRRL